MDHLTILDRCLELERLFTNKGITHGVCHLMINWCPGHHGPFTMSVEYRTNPDDYLSRITEYLSAKTIEECFDNSVAYIQGIKTAEELRWEAFLKSRAAFIEECAHFGVDILVAIEPGTLLEYHA